MQKNGFEKIDDYSDISINSHQPLTSSSKKESVQIPMPLNTNTQQPQLNSLQEYDDDHPAPLSFNPKVIYTKRNSC